MVLTTKTGNALKYLSPLLAAKWTKWQLQPATKQLDFFSKILDYNEFLQPIFELVLSNPQLITLHQSIPSLEIVPSVLLNKLTAFEQCSLGVAHMP